MSISKYHIALSGDSKNKWVKCPAKKSCRNKNSPHISRDVLGELQTMYGKKISQLTIDDYRKYLNVNIAYSGVPLFQVSNEEINNYYNEKQSELQGIMDDKGEGGVRDATGKIFEGMVDLIFSKNTGLYESKVGSNDYVTTEYIHPDGDVIKHKTIQVDRHIWKNGERFGFVECKTYLDAPYLGRAVTDFLEILKSNDLKSMDTSNMKFIVFAGQVALSDTVKRKEEARFYTESKAITQQHSYLDIVFVSPGLRSSKKPLYKNNFGIDFNNIEKFRSYFKG